MTGDRTVDPSIEGGPSFRVTLDGTRDAFMVTPPESILSAARRQGYWLPYECGWGSCSRCKASVVEGEVESLFPAALAMQERDGRRRRHLLCQSTPTSDVTIKPLSVSTEPTAERPTQDHVAILTSRKELGPAILELAFTLDRAAAFRAGQYAIFHLDERLARCYSMSNEPGVNRVEFIVKRYDGHAGSSRMHDLRVGDRVAIELPYGDMYLRDVDRPVILIAGGTGISAILAMLRSMTGDPSWSRRPVHVVYGAGTREELVCWEEVLDLAEALNGQVHGALVAAPDDWHGHSGFVTTALTSLLLGEVAQEHDLLNAEVYLAGPPIMVDAVNRCLQEHGFAWDRVHVDSFG